MIWECRQVARVWQDVGWYCICTRLRHGYQQRWNDTSIAITFFDMSSRIELQDLEPSLIELQDLEASFEMQSFFESVVWKLPHGCMFRDSSAHIILPDREGTWKTSVTVSFQELDIWSLLSRSITIVRSSKFAEKLSDLSKWFRHGHVDAQMSSEIIPLTSSVGSCASFWRCGWHYKSWNRHLIDSFFTACGQR